jgi:hypothetical protein
MIILLCILFFLSSSEPKAGVSTPVKEIPTVIKDTSKTTLTIELVHLLPIGWGTRYTGKLINVVSGESPAFHDSTFNFYYGISTDVQGPNILDSNKIITIHMKKSGEITNKKITWPPNYDSGFTDKNGVVWNMVVP